MPSLIPTFPDPNYQITTNLDGTLYQLAFRYSGREGCYWVDLALQDGTLLVGGKKVVCYASLFARHRYNPLVPQGHIVCIPAAGGSDEPPGLGQLGIGLPYVLQYFTFAEVGH